MKLFKLELERGRRGLDIIVHAETEDAARARVLGKYPGWKVRGELHEIPGPVHFVIAELDPDAPW